MQSDLWKMVVDHVQAMKPRLDPHGLSPQASLTNDLGLDSLDLVELCDRVRADFPQYDIQSWLVEASTPGGDTLATFVFHLERQITGVPGA